MLNNTNQILKILYTGSLKRKMETAGMISKIIIQTSRYMNVEENPFKRNILSQFREFLFAFFSGEIYRVCTFQASNSAFADEYYRVEAVLENFKHTTKQKQKQLVFNLLSNILYKLVKVDVFLEDGKTIVYLQIDL